MLMISLPTAGQSNLGTDARSEPNAGECGAIAISPATRKAADRRPI
jgi:hypothetical protein